MSINKPSKKSQHFKHEALRKERTKSENRYYKRKKESASCKCSNCRQIGYKFIDCTKRKSNFAKLYKEEFEEIEELYSVDIENFNEISSYYESIGEQNTN